MKNLLWLFVLAALISSCGDDEENKFSSTCDYFPYTTSTEVSSRLTIYQEFLGDSTVSETLNESLFMGTKSMFDMVWLESSPQNPVNTSGQEASAVNVLASCEGGYIEYFIPEFSANVEAGGQIQTQESNALRLQLMPVSNLTIGDQWEGGIGTSSSSLTLPDGSISAATAKNTYTYELLDLDVSADIVDGTYDDLAVLEEVVTTETTNTITVNGESSTVTSESMIRSQYYISRSHGVIKVLRYQPSFFNPEEYILYIKQEIFDISL